MWLRECHKYRYTPAHVMLMYYAPTTTFRISSITNIVQHKGNKIRTMQGLWDAFIIIYYYNFYLTMYDIVYNLCTALPKMQWFNQPASRISSGLTDVDYAGFFLWSKCCWWRRFRWWRDCIGHGHYFSVLKSHLSIKTISEVKRAASLTTSVMTRRPRTARSAATDNAVKARPKTPLATGHSWRRRRSPTKRASTESAAEWTSKWREWISTEAARTFLYSTGWQVRFETTFCWLLFECSNVSMMLLEQLQAWQNRPGKWDCA